MCVVSRMQAFLYDGKTGAMLKELGDAESAHKVTQRAMRLLTCVYCSWCHVLMVAWALACAGRHLRSVMGARQQARDHSIRRQDRQGSLAVVCSRLCTNACLTLTSFPFCLRLITIQLWDVETNVAVSTFTFGDDLDNQQLACLWQVCVCVTS
jgi:hypothetical protein